MNESQEQTLLDGISALMIFCKSPELKPQGQLEDKIVIYYPNIQRCTVYYKKDISSTINYFELIGLLHQPDNRILQKKDNKYILYYVVDGVMIEGVL